MQEALGSERFQAFIAGLDRFVATFNSSYVLVKGFIADAAKKVVQNRHFVSAYCCYPWCCDDDTEI